MELQDLFEPETDVHRTESSLPSVRTKKFTIHSETKTKYGSESHVIRVEVEFDSEGNEVSTKQLGSCNYFFIVQSIYCFEKIN